MSVSPNNVHNISQPFNDALVTFGDGTFLYVSAIGKTKLTNDITLNDVLVVPDLTNNLLYVGKLTCNHPLDFLSSQSSKIETGSYPRVLGRWAIYVYYHSSGI